MKGWRPAQTIVLAAAVAAASGAADSRAATTMPSEGWTLHMDAKLHFPGRPDMLAHHWCKGVRDGMTECLLYDADATNARLVGVEVIVGPDVYKGFRSAEKKLWHDHKTELSRVSATLPDLSAEEAAKVVKSIEVTYGKIYLLWDPARTDLPTGKPTVTVLK